MHFKKNICLVAGFILSVPAFVYSQPVTLQYARQIGGSGTYDHCDVIRTDSNGNLIVGGYFSGSNVDFDPGPATAYLSSYSSSYEELFIAKYDANGNYMWAFDLGSYSYLEASVTDIYLDADDNIYVTGNIDAPTGSDFDPGTGVALVTFDGCFFAKYDSNGNFVFVKTFHPNSINRIITDDNKNIYLCGDYQGSTDFDPGPGSASLSSFPSGFTDFFVAKYDSMGNYVWALGSGAGQQDNCYAIQVDDSGNVYATGYFQETVDFDPGPGVFNLSFGGGPDAFVTKYSSAGNLVWAKMVGGQAMWVFGKDLILKENDLYLSGRYYSDSTDFDPGPGIFYLFSANDDYSLFLAKYDTSLTLNWAKQIATPPVYKDVEMIALRNNGIYVTGRFDSTNVDFDPGASTAYLSTNGESDIFVSKYDTSGNYQWAFNIGGPDYDNGSAIAIDAASNVYVSGIFLDSADFDPYAGQFSLVSSGTRDGFYAKYSDNLVGIFCDGCENMGNGFLVFPNPATGYLTIRHSSPLSDLAIYNVLGEMQFHSKPSGSETTLDVSTLAKGIYFVRVAYRGGVLTQKLVIE